MGGEIGVNSEEGVGSEFWFTVRLGLDSGATHEPTLEPADLKGTRILIVDDNATNREILTKRTTSWGMRPLSFPNGVLALQALYKAIEDSDPFLIAVIDMQMPGMNGETLGKAIRADVRLAATRLVMLTSMGTGGDEKHFEALGFAGFATKPIRHQELKSVLSLILSRPTNVESASQHIVTRRMAQDLLAPSINCKARILLAEDNITNQQVALGLLKKLGLRADAVANGQEVLNSLETIPYDLILMDVQMPEMDGLEATRRIRAQKAESLERHSSSHHSSVHVPNPHIPIIAMTAHAMQGDRERCLAAGMNDFVTKPVSIQALADALSKWLPLPADPVSPP